MSAAPPAAPPSAPGSEPLPEVARRRGNADTLFSADWFDDDEKPAPDAGTPAPAPAEKPRAQAAKPAPAVSFADDEDDLPAQGGNRTLLIVGVVGFLLFMMCGGVSVGLGIVYAFAS